jgi:hypothetical protein
MDSKLATETQADVAGQFWFHQPHCPVGRDRFGSRADFVCGEDVFAAVAAWWPNQKDKEGKGADCFGRTA